MNATELTKLLTISENIQEQIQVAGDLWELSDFEITALCGIVSDAFADAVVVPVPQLSHQHQQRHQTQCRKVL